ncbi:hypothetical protein O181_083375, partial [Austropuccinia psidii MF-1]|nr:hypothetical protein [Austropuccinia psidii MF-1]
MHIANGYPPCDCLPICGSSATCSALRFTRFAHTSSACHGQKHPVEVLSKGMVRTISAIAHWKAHSITVQLKCSATEHFNYDPKANLSNGLSQAHNVFTFLTAPPFVQTLSPGHTACNFAAVTTCISEWGTCALHPPCTFNKGLTTTLPGY